MNAKTLELLEELQQELALNNSSPPAVVRIGATDGLMQQIHIKTNKAGFKQLVAEQLAILSELQQGNARNLHSELAEEYSDKVWTIDIRSDINQPLAWEIEKKENIWERMSYWMYGLVILFVLACTLVGLKTIFAFLFLNF